MSSKSNANNHTPLNLEKIIKTFNTAHFGTLASKSNIKISGLDKYSIMLIISALFFVGGLGFWVYVNNFL